MQSPMIGAQKARISPIQQYRKIMMAHDGSEKSDKALGHAAYIAKAAGLELVIINVIETDVIPPSSVLAFLRPDVALDQAKDELRNQLEGGVKQMLDERIKASKESIGLTNVSSMVRFGSPAEEIIAAAEEGNYDLVVMASSKITSPIRTLGSTARKVLDSTRKPVLMIHE